MSKLRIILYLVWNKILRGIITLYTTTNAILYEITAYVYHYLQAKVCHYKADAQLLIKLTRVYKV